MNKKNFYQMLEASPAMPVIPKELSEIFELIRQPDQLEIDILAEKVALCQELNHAFIG